MPANGCERETLKPLYFDFCADVQHTSGYDEKSNHGMCHFVQRKEICGVFLLLMINIS